jgi:succinyl-diaminopimelate desuccinylase
VGAKTLSSSEIVRGFDRDGLVNLASKLIAIPTFDGKEGDAVAFAADFLVRQGVATWLEARDGARPNLIATVGAGKPGRPVVALNGHIDTVPIENRSGWETDPLAPSVREGRLYGLGAIDMKAPLAVLLHVAAHLHRFADSLSGKLQLQLSVDEETGGYNGTKYLIERIKQGALDRPDYVISGERTDLKVSNAERGGLKFEVEFIGRAAHTADARTKGVNPIAAAARAIVALDRPLDEFHPYSGHGVLSVNIVKGGAFISQVPERCTIQVDRRMVPGRTDTTALAEAEGEIRGALRAFPGVRYETRPLQDGQGRPRYYPPNLTPWESPLVQAIVRAHEVVTGGHAEPCTGAFGATDGRLFRYEEIDTVVYGPSGENAHGANEYVDLDSLETQFKVLITALAELLVE